MDGSLDLEFKIDSSLYKNINKFIDGVIYSVARETLDGSYKTIPLSNRVNSGRLRSSSLAYGVQGSNAEYKIGSTTSYAVYVWNMNNNTTNWTTPGTGSEWYTRFFRIYGMGIVSQAIEENKLK